MSTAAEQAKAKIEAIRQRNASTAAPAPEPVEDVAESSRGPVRHTVDMTRARHRQWALWRFEAAGELGLTTLSGQRAFEGLLATLFTDETMSRRVIAKLKSGDY